MLKKCSKCGAANDFDAPFCTNCGARFFKNISDFKKNDNNTSNFEKQPSNLTLQNNSYNDNNPNNQKRNYIENNYQNFKQDKKTSKKKPIVIVLSVIIVIMIVVIAFFVFLPGDKEKKDNNLDMILDSITGEIDGGPSVSMQSLGSGNFQSIPDEDCVAKYYIYYKGEKVGEAVEANSGTTKYKGYNCYKILGRSDSDITYEGHDIEFTIDYTYYVRVDNNIPVYMSMNYIYTKPSNTKASSSISWDQNTGEIKMALPGNNNIIMNFPTEYWGMLSSIDDLYVGYSNNIQYSLTQGGSDTEIEMNIEVEKQEDVTVPAGTFENCYLIEFSQNEANSLFGNPDVFLKIWISEEGFSPKVITKSSGLELTQELEGYYTTK